MKKNAFTLMEMLTTLAIIGLVATLVSPILSNLMPDKAKMQVIKIYKDLSEATVDILGDPRFYHSGTTVTVNGEEIDCPGLTDFNKWVSTDTYSANKDKYYGILKDYQFEINDAGALEDGKYFITRDGVYWIITSTGRAKQGTANRYGIEYIVTVDLNGTTKGPNAIATKDIKNPDTFKFKVDTYGNVTGEDALTKQYLKTRMDFKNKKEDYKAAFPST